MIKFLSIPVSKEGDFCLLGLMIEKVVTDTRFWLYFIFLFLFVMLHYAEIDLKIEIGWSNKVQEHLITQNIMKKYKRKNGNVIKA